jgi:hypothetical protein
MDSSRALQRSLSRRGGWRLAPLATGLLANPAGQRHGRRLTDDEGEEVDAAISPDGKLTVFLSDRGGQIGAWAGQVGSSHFENSKGRSMFYNGRSATPLR